VAPRYVWHPDYWLNTRNRPALPPSVNHSFESDVDARTMPECRGGVKSSLGRVDLYWE